MSCSNVASANSSLTPDCVRLQAVGFDDLKTEVAQEIGKLSGAVTNRLSSAACELNGTLEHRLGQAFVKNCMCRPPLELMPVSELLSTLSGLILGFTDSALKDMEYVFTNFNEQLLDPGIDLLNELNCVLRELSIIGVGLYQEYQEQKFSLLKAVALHLLHSQSQHQSERVEATELVVALADTFYLDCTQLKQKSEYHVRYSEAQLFCVTDLEKIGAQFLSANFVLQQALHLKTARLSDSERSATEDRVTSGLFRNSEMEDMVELFFCNWVETEHGVTFTNRVAGEPTPLEISLLSHSCLNNIPESIFLNVISEAVRNTEDLNAFIHFFRDMNLTSLFYKYGGVYRRLTQQLLLSKFSACPKLVDALVSELRKPRESRDVYVLAGSLCGSFYIFSELVKSLKIHSLQGDIDVSAVPLVYVEATDCFGCLNFKQRKLLLDRAVAEKSITLVRELLRIEPQLCQHRINNCHLLERLCQLNLHVNLTEVLGQSSFFSIDIEPKKLLVTAVQARSFECVIALIKTINSEQLSYRSEDHVLSDCIASFSDEQLCELMELSVTEEKVSMIYEYGLAETLRNSGYELSLAMLEGALQKPVYV